MRQETNQVSEQRLQDLSTEQHHRFIEQVVRSPWLRQWLADVIASPRAEHTLPNQVEGWPNLINYFDAMNTTHQGNEYHTLDHVTLERWELVLDRENKKVIVTFTAVEDRGIGAADIALLGRRIEHMQSFGSQTSATAF